MTEIEKTESEIAVLQSKLELLKEIETHKSQPRMTLESAVEGEVVSYNDEIYYRLEYPTAVIWYKRKGNIAVDASGVKLVCVTDLETHRLLEGLWFNEIRHGKYPEPYCPDEPLEYDEVEHDISENVENKTIRQVIDRWWMDTFTSKNQWDVDTCIDDLADQVQFWNLRNKK